jgi:ABC-2 type transport system permease protein
MSQVFQTIAKVTPLYGLNTLVHAPLTGETLDGWPFLNALVWLTIFVSGAVWRLRKDTARV